jgi:hypothetical protein
MERGAMRRCGSGAASWKREEEAVVEISTLECEVGSIDIGADDAQGSRERGATWGYETSEVAV